MFASGFEFKAESAFYSHGPARNKHPRRIIRALRERQPPTSLISVEPKVSSKCDAIPSSSLLAQILSEHIVPSGEEEIQSGVADEEGSCISTEMDALDLSDIKHKKKTTTNSLQVVMVSRILKGIPQSPHFYHLRNYSEHARKALISAWDGVFEEAVDQIQCLRVNNFWVNAGELWKSMEELQTMGYNVIPLRRRIVELSDVISEVKFCKLEMKKLAIKAENHRAEKCRLEFVILNLQDKMRKVEEQMNSTLIQEAEMEKELPNLDGMFANILREPLIV